MRDALDANNSGLKHVLKMKATASPRSNQSQEDAAVSRSLALKKHARRSAPTVSNSFCYFWYVCLSVCVYGLYQRRKKVCVYELKKATKFIDFIAHQFGARQL